MKLTILAFIVVAFAGCEQRRPAERHEFPISFSGWAVIVWGESGDPALPTEGGKFVMHFPTDGIIITSTQQRFGWASDETYFIDTAGHRSGPASVAFGYTGSVQQRGHTMQFSARFVGTDAELKAAPQSETKVNEAFNRIHPNA